MCGGWQSGTECAHRGRARAAPSPRSRGRQCLPGTAECGAPPPARKDRRGPRSSRPCSPFLFSASSRHRPGRSSAGLVGLAKLCSTSTYRGGRSSCPSQARRPTCASAPKPPKSLRGRCGEYPAVCSVLEEELSDARANQANNLRLQLSTPAVCHSRGHALHCPPPAARLWGRSSRRGAKASSSQQHLTRNDQNNCPSSSVISLQIQNTADAF